MGRRRGHQRISSEFLVNPVKQVLQALEVFLHAPAAHLELCLSLLEETLKLGPLGKDGGCSTLDVGKLAGRRELRVICEGGERKVRCMVIVG